MTSGNQSAAIIKIVGEGGKNLKASNCIRVEDPQFLESENLLDYTVDLVVPPVPPPTPDGKAISLVKRSVLVVEGKRSSLNVEDGFKNVRLSFDWVDRNGHRQ